MITFEHVGKAFADSVAIDDLSLTIEQYLAESGEGHMPMRAVAPYVLDLGRKAVTYVRPRANIVGFTDSGFNPCL